MLIGYIEMGADERLFQVVTAKGPLLLGGTAYRCVVRPDTQTVEVDEAVPVSRRMSTARRVARRFSARSRPVLSVGASSGSSGSSGSGAF